MPEGIISLTTLTLGITLPELAVNLRLFKEKKSEITLGNVLSFSVVNSLMIPPIVSLIGTIRVSEDLAQSALPVMAARGLIFYLLTHGKNYVSWGGASILLPLCSVFIKFNYSVVKRKHNNSRLKL